MNSDSHSGNHDGQDGGQVAEAEQTVLLEAAKISEGTKKLVAEQKPTGQKEAETVTAETEKKVAAVDKQCADLDGSGRWRWARPRMRQRRCSKRPRPNCSSWPSRLLAIPRPTRNGQFAEGLPENIELKMIYSGPGTLWTDLKGLTPVLNVKPDKAEK